MSIRGIKNNHTLETEENSKNGERVVEQMGLELDSEKKQRQHFSHNSNVSALSVLPRSGFSASK